MARPALPVTRLLNRHRRVAPPRTPASGPDLPRKPAGGPRLSRTIGAKRREHACCVDARDHRRSAASGGWLALSRRQAIARVAPAAIKTGVRRLAALRKASGPAPARNVGGRIRTRSITVSRCQLGSRLQAKPPRGDPLGSGGQGVGSDVVPTERLGPGPPVAEEGCGPTRKSPDLAAGAFLRLSVGRALERAGRSTHWLSHSSTRRFLAGAEASSSHATGAT